MKNDEKRGVSKRTVAILLALVLVIGCAVGGTLAWLTAQTSAVQNTFTPSDINIHLTETWNTDADGDGTPDSWSAKMVPGFKIAKDPKVWVDSDSEDCFLFVKLDWANNSYTSGEETKPYLTCNIADGWQLVSGETNVYYRTVTSTQMSKDNGSNNAFKVLANDTVSVSNEITKGQMNAFTTETLPKLTITAYACQLYSTNGTEFSVADAWNNAKGT